MEGCVDVRFYCFDALDETNEGLFGAFKVECSLSYAHDGSVALSVLGRLRWTNRSSREAAKQGDALPHRI
ncbi:hypothetical protein PTI98_001279 [Pleurotus ostreatus]|nr:hypothetical protein PTI98_001279 [Pleurotus ostreatus]